MCIKLELSMFIKLLLAAVAPTYTARRPWRQWVVVVAMLGGRAAGRRCWISSRVSTAPW